MILDSKIAFNTIHTLRLSPFRNYFIEYILFQLVEDVIPK